MSLQNRKDVRLARAAYQAALAGDLKKAGRYVRRISDECGGGGLEIALRAWCDTYMDHATDGADGAAVEGVSFWCVDTGQIDRPGSERVPGHIQWADRMVEARARMDKVAWKALLGELPDDGFEIGTHVMAVLRVVSTTVNGMPRGFAVMGRGESHVP